ncbi:DUF885 domain-containing protein [Kutzneria buriramensis]|uniref:Uncharacterized protein (DUF885 family) n=1 Tax=Kutzneria buriramensis TaxID=1045776 RepID=A0A3E0GWJ2_9PSEU|nr:DUF885 domain-containing protein [Kutzneria buriramensis]REH32505.1 uncharacterized protein (DUF885 family) [Kutzneria buriramensis]
MTLVTSFLDWYLPAHPMTASYLGLTEHDNTLGDHSEAGFLARERAHAEWLTRFTDAAAPTEFSDLIDHELVLAHLRGQRARADWPAWRRDPAVYVGEMLSVLHASFQHRLRPEPELVASALSRLAELPGVYAACRANLDAELASPLIVRRALDQLRTTRQFLTAVLPGGVENEKDRARLVEAGEKAADAADALAAYLDEFANRATGDWRMGEKLYSTLLTEYELLGYGASELHARGEAAYAELHAEATELAGGDWRAAVRALQDNHPPTLDALLEAVTEETERARRFLRERDLVTFAEGEECRVVPTPTFLRPLFAVPAYMPSPAMTASRIGHHLVPFTPDGATPEQVEQRLRTNAYDHLRAMAVHEAYPGHHWHFSWHAGNPRPVRKVFRTSYFAEGWALYAERMMREQGYYETTGQLLAHLDFRLFRAARIIVDTELHCGDMTVAQAEEFMTTRYTHTAGTAKVEVSRYCAWPTQAPSYLTGALEIEATRDEFLARGLGTLKSFHDRIAGSGALPLGLARRVVLEQPGEQAGWR